MEWKSNLRRTQSMRSVSSSCDQPSWTGARLQDKITSVSQLVSRYQTTVEVSASTQGSLVNNGEAKPKQVFKEKTPSLLVSKDTSLEALVWRNEERERSRAKTNLARSKSMGSLQNSAGSIGALKALFESKAATQSKTQSGLRAASSPSAYRAADIVPMMNGEAEEVSAGTPGTVITADASAHDAKGHHVPRKVANQTRMERRKTIGGIDFEKIAASQADEKRRSIADFRDSSKEKLCVSVKAMSAIYLSKVAPRESTNSLLKPVQRDQTPGSGKGVKPLRMADNDPSTRHQPGSEDISGPHFQLSTPSQLSKEKLYQQRQKCELRRLMKHTHPELKMLDDAVDEELAEVLSSETGVATGETGYEGEVLSRRLIFESCAMTDKVSNYTPKRHMAEGTAERGNVGKTSAEFEEKPSSEGVKGTVEDVNTLGCSPDPSTECEEEIRIDVQATRRIFESQCLNTSTLTPHNKFKGKASISGVETGAVQKRQQESGKENIPRETTSNVCGKSPNLTHQHHQPRDIIEKSNNQDSSVWEEVGTGETVFEDAPPNLPDAETCGEMIKTSATLVQNNPFISANVEREHSFAGTTKFESPAGEGDAAQDYPSANVRNRAHLFESMPFDKIRQQNKDEVETMVENIKETLNSLYHVSAIHSGGSIIEVNETMIAKKARFMLSEAGPEIKYDEVAEGGAQNFILQLLPRANLRRQITYLKEDSKGSMKATMVNVPMHQHQFATNQDTEFKTANVAQVVEDILNQDNSLRKGVIIQEHADACAEVIVYSLYNYFDEDDVKSYCPSQGPAYDEPEPETVHVDKRDNPEIRKGAVESTISCLLETSKDQTCQGSVRPEITVKGNVKLFRSCIEKGDLEYLKGLQDEPTAEEQEPPSHQNVSQPAMELHNEQRCDQAEENTAEWVPVDIKRLKNMFSGDKRPVQPKQNAWEMPAQSTTISCAFTGKSVPLGENQPTEGKAGVAPQISYGDLQPQDEGLVLQAELVEVVDDSDEISNLQTAIHSLQQATFEAKSLQHSSQDKRKILFQETKEPVVSSPASNIEAACTKPRRDDLPSASKIMSHETVEACCTDGTSEKVQRTTVTCRTMGEKGTEVVQKSPMTSEHSSETTAAQEEEEEEEVVFQGKLQAALNSLERSNINVTRGDFRAAMIYRNSPKPNKERSQGVAAVSVQKRTEEEFCPQIDPESSQAPLRQEVSKDHVTPANAESETLNIAATNAVLEKGKRPGGSKPAIPPKPQHLKQRDIQSFKAKIPNEIVPEPSSPTSNDEHKQDQFKINSGGNKGPDSGGHKSTEVKPTSVFQETEARQKVHGPVVTLTSDKVSQQQEINVTLEQKSPEDLPTKETTNETDESHVDFHEARKKFGGKNVISVKTAPVKPKRVKIAQPENKNPKQVSILTRVAEEPQPTLTGPPCANQNTCGQTTNDNADKCGREVVQKSRVEMREKKGRAETEDERRQRLSVHMDEIMRGNITAAMEIFDNLRKQEELQSILSRVEEIEQDTSEVDVRSLRGVFENVPDWVVSSDKKKQRRAKVENKEDGLPLTRDNTENKSPVAHVFGDLERASEEIMNLKEQTLARLMDIEGAIKKALYSVSTLKSDSDIAGLSCLFKESLGTVQGSPSSGNISKISIGSSRTRPLQTHDSPVAQGVETPTINPSAGVEAESAKQRASPPSSPAFISIQSAARKTDRTDALLPEPATVCPTCQHSPKTEEKYRTTKTLTCNSPAQNRKRDPRKGGQKQPSRNPKRELSVLEVQTNREGNGIMGAKTVTENYERTDNLGNRFYSSKTSTVVGAQPETSSQTVGPAAYQVTKYPEVRLPINQKP